MAVDRFFTVSFSEFERDFPLDRKRLTSRHFETNYKGKTVVWMGRVVYLGALDIQLRIFPWLETTPYNAILTYTPAVLSLYTEQPEVGKDFWFCATILSMDDTDKVLKLQAEIFDENIKIERSIMYPTISSLCGEYETAHLEDLMQFWIKKQFNMIGYILNIEQIQNEQSAFSRELSFEVVWPRYKPDEKITVIILVQKEGLSEDSDIEKIGQEFITESRLNAYYKKLVDIFVHPFVNLQPDGHLDLPKDRYNFILDSVQSYGSDKFVVPDYIDFNSAKKQPPAPISKGPQPAAPKIY
ncbi:MAG: hypothetical protein EZS28_028750, partial [Streblomastix strix]